MGTNQMITLIGMAQDSKDLETSIDSVDKALLITPCVMSTFVKGPPRVSRYIGSFYVDLMLDIDANYIYGEGSSPEANT